MNQLCEVAGIDGDVWWLVQDGDEMFLQHAFSKEAPGPRTTMPVDEHVLDAMLYAARAAAVVVSPAVADAIVDFAAARCQSKGAVS